MTNALNQISLWHDGMRRTPKFTKVKIDLSNENVTANRKQVVIQSIVECYALLCVSASYKCAFCTGVNAEKMLSSSVWKCCVREFDLMKNNWNVDLFQSIDQASFNEVLHIVNG